MPEPTKRLPNWRSRLSAEMDRQRREPFAWGSHDCALGLASAAIEAVTGEDLRARWGGYSTAAGALKVLRRAGYDSLADAVAATLPEIHPSRASIGDIGLIEAEGEIGAALCVFDASGVVVMTEAGHGRVARSKAVRAFRVG